MSLTSIRSPSLYLSQNPQPVPNLSPLTFIKSIGQIASNALKERYCTQLQNFVNQIIPYLDPTLKTRCTYILHDAHLEVTLSGSNLSKIDCVMNNQRLRIAEILKDQPNILTQLRTIPTLPQHFTYICDLIQTHIDLDTIDTRPEFWLHTQRKYDLAQEIIKSSNRSYVKDCACLLPEEIIQSLLNDGQIDEALEIIQSLSCPPHLQSELLNRAASRFIRLGLFTRAIETCSLIPSTQDREVLFQDIGQKIWGKQSPALFQKSMNTILSISSEPGKTSARTAFVRFLMENKHFDLVDTFQKALTEPQEKALIQEFIAAELFYSNKEQEALATLKTLVNETPDYQIGRYVSSIVLPDLLDLLIEDGSWDLAWTMLLSFNQALPRETFETLSVAHFQTLNISWDKLWSQLFAKYLEEIDDYKALNLAQTIFSLDPKFSIQLLHRLANKSPLMTIASVELFAKVAKTLTHARYFEDACCLTMRFIDNPNDRAGIMNTIIPIAAKQRNLSEKEIIDRIFNNLENQDFLTNTV